LTVPIHKELGKIPLDEATQCPGLFALEILVQRISVVAVHVYLSEQIKLGVFFVPREILDFRICTRFLATKLITGEGEYSQAFRVEFLVQLL